MLWCKKGSAKFIIPLKAQRSDCEWIANSALNAVGAKGFRGNDVMKHFPRLSVEYLSCIHLDVTATVACFFDSLGLSQQQKIIDYHLSHAKLLNHPPDYHINKDTDSLAQQHAFL
jgi:hypothetical protein